MSSSEWTSNAQREPMAFENGDWPTHFEFTLADGGDAVLVADADDYFTAMDSSEHIIVEPNEEGKFAAFDLEECI